MGFFIKYGIIVFFIVFIAYCIRNKLHIDFTSFFKKGFKLFNDKFRLLLFYAVSKALGKTLSCVSWISHVRSKNQKVITNVYSYYLNNKSFVIYEPDFYQIVSGFKNGLYNTNYIIFYDEIFTLIEKGKLDRSILSFISQLRKRKIYLVTTAQEWLEINVTFRRYVRYQIDCRMIRMPIFNTAFSINEINDGYQMHWDNLQNEYVSPRIRTTFRKCSKKLADSYDTFEVIKDI